MESYNLRHRTSVAAADFRRVTRGLTLGYGRPLTRTTAAIKTQQEKGRKGGNLVFLWVLATAGLVTNATGGAIA